MKVVRYQIPKRLEVSHMGRTQSVQPLGDDAYQLTDLEDDSQEIWSYSEVLSLLKMSETRRKDPFKAVSRSAARIRDGGLQCRSQLSSRQDDILDFRLALMYGIRDLDKNNVPIYAAGLDKPDIRLGKLFGNGADIWIQMQSAYDVWHASRDVDVSGIPTLKTAT